MMSRFLTAVTTVAVCLFLAGCMTVKFGRPPATERIEKELKPRVSTKADVLRVLGAPRGYGQALITSVGHKRTIWFYELTEAKIWSSEVRFKLLLVFFDGDRKSVV